MCMTDGCRILNRIMTPQSLDEVKLALLHLIDGPIGNARLGTSTSTSATVLGPQILSPLLNFFLSLHLHNSAHGQTPQST